MAGFMCANCGAALTVPVERVALPVHAHQKSGYGLLGVLMEPGTYAVKPGPFGPPWRPWAEVTAAQAEAAGVYAPVYALSEGPRGAVVVAPGDMCGTAFIPERSGGYCCGVDGRDGPNLACSRCGRPVATRIDDCGHWQAVWLDPGAVRRITGGGRPPEPLTWNDLQAGAARHTAGRAARAVEPHPGGGRGSGACPSTGGVGRDSDHRPRRHCRRHLPPSA